MVSKTAVDDKLPDVVVFPTPEIVPFEIVPVVVVLHGFSVLLPVTSPPGRVVLERFVGVDSVVTFGDTFDKMESFSFNTVQNGTKLCMGMGVRKTVFTYGLVYFAAQVPQD